jgi:cell division septum initiation protein DivIVA
MSQEVDKLLDSVVLKAEKLLKSRQTLLDKVQKLEQINFELNNELDTLRKDNESLREANQVLRMAKAVSGEDQNTRDLKLRINDYIREIDRCLALINR